MNSDAIYDGPCATKGSPMTGKELGKRTSEKRRLCLSGVRVCMCLIRLYVRECHVVWRRGEGCVQ